MMPSNRRLKVFFSLVVLLVLLTLYITASARQTRSSQFYENTQDALAAARAAKEAKLSGTEVATGEDSMVVQRLKQAETIAKLNADKKGDKFHGEETKQKAIKAKESAEKNKSEDGARRDPATGEKGVAGRKIMKDDKEAVLMESNEKEPEEKKNAKGESEDEQKAHNELNDILKKSPIIIFSKTFCPYSRRAKHILLEKYSISPAPYVVELDEHPFGAQLQAYLGDITGRRTVPNVLINARSIGGGDDVQALDTSGKLIDTVKTMGGKRMEIHKVGAEKTDTDSKKKKKKLRV